MRAADRKGRSSVACSPRQRQRAERLAEESVGTDSNDALFGDLTSGEKQDGNPSCGRIGFQQTAEIQPVDDRHGHVEDDDVGLSQLDHLGSGSCAVRFLDVDMGELEGGPQQGAKIRVVVHDQDGERLLEAARDLRSFGERPDRVRLTRLSHRRSAEPCGLLSFVDLGASPESD